MTNNLVADKPQLLSPVLLLNSPSDLYLLLGREIIIFEPLLCLLRLLLHQAVEHWIQ